MAAGVACVLLLSGATFGHARSSTAEAAFCGDNLTASVTLTADLDCPVTDGLIIGANNIVVNLNGHLIEGSGTVSGIVDTGHTGDTVENGTIDNFNNGIDASNANNLHLTGLRVMNNATEGIVVNTSPGTVISGDLLELNSNQNISYSGGTGTVTITGNRSFGASIGIIVSSVTTATVTSNVASDSGSEGFDIVGITSGMVSSNTSEANGGDGFDITSIGQQPKPTVTVAHNRAAFNTGIGFSTDFVVDGGGNVVQANGNSKECVFVTCDAVSS